MQKRSKKMSFVRLVPDYYDKAIRQAGIVPVLVEIPPLERVKIKRMRHSALPPPLKSSRPFELRDYKAPNPISLKPDKRAVTDEQIDKAFEVLREQMAQLHPAPPGSALAEGDYAVLDVEGFLDGHALEGTKKEGHLHKVGSKMSVLGIDVDSHVIGKKESEVVDIPQPYPANHPDPKSPARP